MRALFTTWAWPSHLYAMVPLAWALRSAGHEVLVACQPSLAEAVTRTGLTPVVVGADVDSVSMVRSYALPTRRFGEAAPPATGRVPRALRMFLANAEAMVDDLAVVTRAWRPDVLIHDPTAWAGPIAAAAAGVPAVRHLYGADLAHRARRFVPELLAEMGERHGLDDLGLDGLATVDPFPASLQFPADYARLPMRYVPYNGPGRVPVDAPAAGRPRVCVTWGTTVSRMHHDRLLAGEVARALDGLDAEVVVAVTGAQRDLLGELPANARVIVDAPLSALVSSCAALVAHGGAGTSMTALTAGLPQLLVPQLPDHLAHATQLQRAGAAIVLPPDEAVPGEIREQVQRLLKDEPARAAAEGLRAEIERQPAPADVVATLEGLL